MPQVEVLADHTLLLALPAFAPAVVVVGVVVWVAIRDRRDAAETDGEDSGSEDSAIGGEDGSP